MPIVKYVPMSSKNVWKKENKKKIMQGTVSLFQYTVGQVRQKQQQEEIYPIDNKWIISS